MARHQKRIILSFRVRSRKNLPGQIYYPRRNLDELSKTQVQYYKVSPFETARDVESVNYFV